jgi:predicted DNA-binding transcriptional regulator AlpA
MSRSPQSLTLAAAAQMGDASLLTATETADVLRVSERTVERWRSTGEGPAFVRVGPRRVAYRVRDVLSFAGAG